MSDYFISYWHENFSDSLEKRIDKAIREIDPEASFYKQSIPGNHVHAVLVRPNDGTNNYADQRALNRRMVETVNNMRQSRATRQ